MFKLCLFDLDDTLLRTSDMDALRRSGKNVDTQEYRKSVIENYKSRADRHIYSQDFLISLRKKFPDIKFGIFTRSPKSYAEEIVNAAYPDFDWNVGVTYESVHRTKPYGDGIWSAMKALEVEKPEHVIMVGDGDVDIRSAYNAGAAVVLDKSSWAQKWVGDNWDAMGHMPDAIIENVDRLPDVLSRAPAYGMDLERRLSGYQGPPALSRFDQVGKFIIRSAGGDNTRYPVYTCGRYFSGDQSLNYRRGWHPLTQSIHANKDAEAFPAEWVASIIGFLKGKYAGLRFGFGVPLVITVIPPRPERKPRLANLLAQLETASKQDPFFANAPVSFDANLLVYKAGVRSHHGEGLSGAERFQNVRQHLAVSKPDVASGRRVLVIDDVCTTGASLIYAGKYLEEAGAREVTRLSIAMNISKVV